LSVKVATQGRGCSCGCPGAIAASDPAMQPMLCRCVGRRGRSCRSRDGRFAKTGAHAQRRGPRRRQPRTERSAPSAIRAGCSVERARVRSRLSRKRGRLRWDSGGMIVQRSRHACARLATGPARYRSSGSVSDSTVAGKPTQTSTVGRDLVGQAVPLDGTHRRAPRNADLTRHSASAGRRRAQPVSITGAHGLLPMLRPPGRVMLSPMAW
jgi:hypothetical protein